MATRSVTSVDIDGQKRVPMEPAMLVQLSLFALQALEGVDNSLLGASTDATMEDLSFTWSEIGYMNMLQGVATNACAIFWGIAADRGIADRKTLLIIAAVGQGIATIALALLSSYGWEMIVLRILNGVFLSGLRPICNGIIADKTDEEVRGKVFSRAQCAFLIGLGLCNYIVVQMAVTYYDLPIFGLQRGWRVSWIAAGLLSIIAALFAGSFFPSDKKEYRVDGTILQMASEELGAICQFMCIPTFVFMILQGFFGTIPWTVMWVMNRFYLFAGRMTREQVATVTSLNPLWGIFGTLLGGYVADFLAGKYGQHGRPLNAQISVALGVPIMYMNFIGISPDFFPANNRVEDPSQGFWGANGAFVMYMLVNFSFGILASWAQGGTNFPILSEIVPEDKRSRVLAVEGAMENSAAMIAGSNLVPILSRAVLGFDLDTIGDQTKVCIECATAVGYSLGLATAVPWLLAFVIYSVLHWSYPRDMRRLYDGEGQVQRARSSFVVAQYSVNSIDHIGAAKRASVQALEMPITA